MTPAGLLGLEEAARIPLIHALVLGVVQGVTEFIPISSSGHLILVPWLFGWDELNNNPDLNQTFDVALHLGTLIGASAYFAPDLRRLARAGISSIRRRRAETTDERQAWLLLLSAIPGALTGALLESFITDRLGKEWLIAVLLIVFGLVLAAADRLPGTRREADFGLRDAATMGVAQALALAPGVSRSGVTISAGRWLRMSRDAAARLSFLMGLPLIAGAAAYEGVDVLRNGGIPESAGGAFAVGIVASAVTGAWAISALLRRVRTKSFKPYVAYRIAAGAVVLGLLATGARSGS